MTTTRSFHAFDLKADAAAPGVVTGRASVYGVIDNYGDIVMPGAFTKTLQGNRGGIVVLSQHHPMRSIGRATLTDRSDGLHSRIQLLLDIPDAAAKYARVKADAVRASPWPANRRAAAPSIDLHVTLAALASGWRGRETTTQLTTETPNNQADISGDEES